MKSTTELIVHTAVGHLFTRVLHHLQRFSIISARVCAKEKLKRHRRWKLRRTTKPAVYRVVGSGDAGERGVEQFPLNRLIRTTACTEPSQFVEQ